MPITKDKDTMSSRRAQPPRGSYVVRAGTAIRNLRKVRQDPDAGDDLIRSAEELADAIEGKR